MSKIIKVLVVDDSAYVRKVVRQMLSRSPFLEVVGTARDGEEALEMVERLQPDVVTLDLLMPGLDGAGFLAEQMKRCPLPVIVVSIASQSGSAALAALDLGAIDFIQKPTALATEKVFEISDELTEKVKAAAGVRLSHLAVADSAASKDGSKATALSTSARDTAMFDAVVIGISTGGPQALKQVIPRLPADFPVPIGIVLHMPVGYTEMYSRKLDEISALRVVEASEGQVVEPGLVVLAQAGRHLYFNRRPDGAVVTHLDARPFDTPHRPAVDVLFQSAAEVYKNRVLGVVMTGMGSDGRQGAAWIKSQGGAVFTESESSCVVYGMPGSVVEAGLSDRSVALDEMARAILEAV
jgi:two-component system chemotaxis response regulator CheB